ncbi:MAG: sigma-54-dependent Fis family transcriptional regulator [Neisseriaceae bacterium]|nr:sigma-54-dependent Fis family transcriptional regulator [Neisseriaceae bacterium]
MKNSDILIVDDEIGIRNLLSEILQDEGYTVATAENVETARKLRQETRPAMVLLDIWLPDSDGITLLKEWAREGLLDMPVIMMSGHASIDTAVEATKIGALDFLEKPIALQKLLTAVKNAFKYSKMQETVAIPTDKFGKSKIVAELTERLKKAAEQPVNTVIMFTGEPGSPFLQTAEYFRNSQRPWIAPNAEQWLKPTQDWFRAAKNGVLYLGNLAEYSLEVQSAIYKTICQRDPTNNARILAACSRSLGDLVTHPNFDHRLGEMMSGFVIYIPPLREHTEDLDPIINQIVLRLVESKQTNLVKFTSTAIGLLRQYNWPGNFDQLRQVVKNLALIADNNIVDAHHVTYILEQYRTRFLAEKEADENEFDYNKPLRDLRQDIEKRYFEYHIFKHNSNMSKVAKEVDLERTHLYRKLKQLGIRFPRRRASSKDMEDDDE